ncbi:late embryogenesis abundant protein 6-like [Salvia miltiorrhiza]|uniref:late embryogenesis abundant protein 6-like n=1 Tax=Salvia miltiorrhiza TaxID=226208 RepID=UPI0025AD30B0|nr:late embryogenesis abundant protein 6-like [Salvia miltiorrhiza]
MQAIKEKINDLKEIRKAKAEAKEGEKAERELARARLEVAHEVRMAREAEAAMDYHVQKAAEKAAEHEKKFPQDGLRAEDGVSPESHGRAMANSSEPPAPYSSDLYSGGAAPDSGHNKANFIDAASSPSEAAAPPSQNNFL